MTATELIKSYRITITMVDGTECLRIDTAHGKPTSKEVDYIKANKPGIIAEIKAIESAKQAKKESEEAAKKAHNKTLIESGEAKLVVVYSGSYYMDCAVCYVTKDGVDQSQYADWCSGKVVRLVETVEEIHKAKKVAKEITEGRESIGTYTSAEAVIYEVSKEEAQKIINAEKGIIKEEKIVAEAKTAEEEARVKGIKETAKATGTKQLLRSYMDDCNDPHEQCSLDHVSVYAMPDGTEMTARQHTW